MGLISRVKTWIFQEDLASADLNAEFDNVLNNLDSGHIVGDSASVGQMQTTVSPGAVGSESLAANVQGEIERLRFVIKRILGSFSPQWYSAPPADLTTIFSALPNLSQLQNGVVSGAADANGQPMWLVPDGATNTVRLKAASTNLICYINGVLTTFSADVALTGLTLAPGSNNTALIDKNPSGGNYANNASSKASGEPDSNYVVADPTAIADVYPIGNYLLLKTIGSNITAQNEKRMAFKIGTEYAVGVYRNAALTRLEDCMRGCFFDSANASLARVGFADGDTLTLEQIAYIFVLQAGTLDVTYNAPTSGSQTPSSPASGDYWYDTANNLWKKYSGVAFVSTPACYLGMCIQNATATVAARSTDPIGGYSDQSGVLLRRDATTNTHVQCAQAGSVSVYGKYVGLNALNFDYYLSRDKEGSLAAGDFLFFYVSSTGNQLISNLAPNRRPELGGYYHPSKPYRCLASGYTSAGTAIDYSLKNLKPVSLQRRVLLARNPVSYASAASSTIVTLKVLARGGRLLVRLNGGTVSVSNSGSNASTFKITASISDEYADAITGQTLGEVSCGTDGSAIFAAAGGFSVEPGEFMGAVTITIATTITGAGTVAAAATSYVEVWEMF